MLDCSPSIEELAVIKGTRFLFEFNANFSS